MKCEILFSEKNKNNISLSSAELAQRVVKTYDTSTLLGNFLLFFREREKKGQMSWEIREIKKDEHYINKSM